MSKFLSNRMICLYLDQDASSRLCSSNPESESWRKIRSITEELHKKLRILIPLSIEHLIETSRRRIGFNEQDQIMRRLSFGTSLLREYDIVASELIVLARIRNLRKSDYFAKGNLRSISEVTVRDKLIAISAKHERITTDIHSFPNQIKDITRKHRLPPLKHQLELVDIRMKYLASELISSLGQLEIGISPIRLHYESSGQQIPRWNDVICRGLYSTYAIKPAEASLIRKKIQKEGLRIVPTLYSRFKINGLLDTRRIKMDSHDSLDIMRAATALSSSDIVVLDGGIASVVKEAGLDAEMRCQVFSCREHEVPKLLQKLESLL